MDTINTIWDSTTTDFMLWNVDGSTAGIITISPQILDAIRVQWTNEIDDKDMEIYQVLHSTYVFDGWKGWCINLDTGKAVACP